MKRCITAFAAAALVSSAGADIIVDDFSDAFASEEFVFGASGGVITAVGTHSGLEVGNLPLTNGAGVGDVFNHTARVQEIQSQAGLDGVLGGSRSSVLSAADPNPANLGSRVAVNAFEGFGLSFSTAFGTHGILDLRYDAGGAGLDLDASGELAFNIEHTTGDLDDGFNPRPIPITLTLTSGLGSGAEATHSEAMSILAEGPYLYDLALFSGSGVDLSDIDVISINIDQSDPITEAADFALGPFAFIGGEVPAPGPLALLFLGSGVIARRRR